MAVALSTAHDLLKLLSASTSVLQTALDSDMSPEQFVLECQLQGLWRSGNVGWALAEL